MSPTHKNHPHRKHALTDNGHCNLGTLSSTATGIQQNSCYLKHAPLTIFRCQNFGYLCGLQQIWCLSIDTEQNTTHTKEAPILLILKVWSNVLVYVASPITEAIADGGKMREE